MLNFLEVQMKLSGKTEAYEDRSKSCVSKTVDMLFDENVRKKDQSLACSIVVADFIEFLEVNGFDALQCLCQAIESLGAENDEEGNATVFMDSLYDAACEITRRDQTSA
jgi:hypothetical protein